MQMIKIITTNGESKLLANYHDVCNYINSVERRNALEKGKIDWFFTSRGYETLSYLYYRNPTLSKEFFTHKEKEAIKNRVGLVEILKGGMENCTQILFNLNLDLEALKRKWCHEYCKAHGIKICEFVERKID